MKTKYSFLTLAVLVLSMLVTPLLNAAEDVSKLVFPGNKSIGELSATERSNYIYMLEHPPVPTTVEQAKSTIAEIATGTKQTVATNINQVMVEILSGVKNASGEIYNFSKQEIGQAYDYLKENAKGVVHEFLLWQGVKAGVWIFVWTFVACLLFYFARQLKLYATKSGRYWSDATGFKWIFRVVACVILVITLGVNGMTIAKICVAPRVYIIQYVLDVAQGNNVQQYR